MRGASNLDPASTLAAAIATDAAASGLFPPTAAQ